MQTLSYGFKKPQNPDKGDVWFPAMEANIQQLNDHTHNGTNSAYIATQPNQVPTTQVIAAASWVAVAGIAGLYRQLVTMPGTLVYDTSIITMRLANGNIVYAQIEKAAASQYYVYTNDNTLAFLAVYS